MVDGIKDAWIKDGYLKIEKRPDAHRDLREYVVVGRPAVVSSEHGGKESQKK